VGDVLKRVHNTMSVIVSRVDAPFIARVRMASIPDTISMGIFHVGVDVLHVNLESEGTLSFLESSSSHLLEKL
jgi:hypothetical protein